MDQMKIFSNSKNIIAPHGAGLSWLFLCNPKVNIIEIRSLVNDNFLYDKIIIFFIKINSS
jgi:capsular polysaccharide biosynthesis protein